MDQERWQQRLSRITTLWTLVAEAHRRGAEETGDARQQLMQRYCGAVYQYLLGALRDEDAAADLFQEFVVRFLRGDFGRADSTRGRFRDYVKKAVINLVNDYHRQRQAWPKPLPADLAAAAVSPAECDLEADFRQAWRQELLDRAWAALRQSQPTFYTVLYAHQEHPDLSSSQLAELLTPQGGQHLTATSVRVTLHRARQKFGDLLLQEVERSLGAAGKEELLQELRDLQLFKWCSAALARRERRRDS